jgi:hypothetical protein
LNCCGGSCFSKCARQKRQKLFMGPLGSASSMSVYGRVNRRILTFLDGHSHRIAVPRRCAMRVHTLLTCKRNTGCNTQFSQHERSAHETHLPAVGYAAPSHTRLPGAHEIARGQGHPSCAPRDRACFARGVTKSAKRQSRTRLFDSFHPSATVPAEAGR